MTSLFFRVPCAVVAASLLLASCSSDNSNSVSNQTANVEATATPQSLPFAALTQVFVPGKNEQLVAHLVSPKTREKQISAESVAPALEELLLVSTKYFPSGTKIKSVKTQGDTATLDLNKNFADSKFWMTKGEKTTELALYSLVNSAAQSDVKKVDLRVEGKPIPTLGQIDTEGFIEARSELIGKS